QLKLLVDFIEYRVDIGNVLQRDQLHPIFLKMGDSLEIVSIMTPHFEDTGSSALPLDGFFQMRTAYVHPLGEGRPGKVFAGREKMLNLPEYPRISDGSPPDHNSVHFVFHAPGGRFFYTVHIAVAKYRYAD